MEEHITVEGVSKTGTGVVLADKTWRNVKKGGEALFAGLKKGDVVKLTKDGNDVTKIEIISAAPMAPAKKAWAPGAPKETSPVNIRQTAVNAAMSAPWLGDVSAEEAFSNAKEYAVSLEKFITTGKF